MFDSDAMCSGPYPFLTTRNRPHYRRYLAEGGSDRRVLTSEVFAKKYASDMELPSTTEAFMVSDAKNWNAEQEKFPIRVRLT